MPFLAVLAAALGGCIAVNIGEPDVISMERGHWRLQVTQQKRMSFGFFPALAEEYCRPTNSIKPMVSWRHEGEGQYFRTIEEPAFRYLFCGWMATPWSLLVTPWHGEYPCDTHDWSRNHAELIRLLPYADQEKLHVKTWHDSSACSWWTWDTLTHASLFGFHRYETVVVEESGDEEME